jgi:mRNA interferase RelE/StbE
MKDLIKQALLELFQERRDIFADLFDVKRIKQTAVKKKITAVIVESQKASSILDLKNVKKLEGSKAYYRIRVGDYRIGVKLQDKKLIFMRCLNRKDIYRYFP